MDKEILEIWRDIIGYEGLYQVSNLGRVKSLARFRKNNKGAYWMQEKILVAIQSTVYLVVSLSKNGKSKQYCIHYLVCTAFHGEKLSDGYEVCHNDGNEFNNKSINLRWGTPKDNKQDSMKHGTLYKGIRHHLAKLSENDVRQVRYLRSEGMSLRNIADLYGISFSNVSLIDRNKIWKHLS